MNIEEKKWEILLTAKQLEERISVLGESIRADYEGKNLLIVALLKGSFIFCADLVRAIDIHTLSINFMTTSSYGNTESSSGKVLINSDINIDDLRDYDVLVVDDITDSAHTMTYVINHLRLRNPKSIKSCVLLDKPSRRAVEYNPDYCGFIIEDKFVVGYGFDFEDRYRNVPYIFHVTDEPR